MSARSDEGDLLASDEGASPAELAKALDEIAASTAEQLLDLRARVLAAERRLERLETGESRQDRERGTQPAKASGGKRTKAEKAPAPADRRERTAAEIKAELTPEQIEQIREERRLARLKAKPKKR